MAEIFKPRENMIFQETEKKYICVDKAGCLVCDGGPSIIWENGNKFLFYQHVIGLHRLDGPATHDGVWGIYGTNVTEKIEKFAEENDIDLNNLTDEDKVMIALRFG